MLEVLNCLLVLLRRGSSGEGTKVFALAGLGVGLARVDAKLTGL